MAGSPTLSLDPAVVTAADVTESQGLLMQGLNKAGVGETLADAKLSIDGWVESGYTYSNRGGSGDSDHRAILPGPFNHEHGNHYMLNQAVIRIAREVSTKEFDVGGMVEFMYGSDAARIHARGLGYDGSDPSDDFSPRDNDSVNTATSEILNYNPIWQFDIPQAYLTVNVPLGTGLQVTVGKFATLLGYESFNAVANSLYSHSYLFTNIPFTHTGVMGSYQITDQLGMKLAVTRGWDVATEDNNGAVDVLGRVSYKVNKQLSLDLNYSIGPEDDRKIAPVGPVERDIADNGHYRVAIDPIVRWQVNNALQLGLEMLYVYDGGRNAQVNGSSVGHAYGDFWGAALYAGYKINNNFTVNGRLEYAHNFTDNIGEMRVQDLVSYRSLPALNIYEITLGVTITPMPNNDILKGLTIRPEIRYDFSDTSAFKFFGGHNAVFRDQFTAGFDVIYEF
jgi:hypothetical protein